MKIFNTTKEDIELVEVATQKITMLYEDDKHHVGAAIRTKKQGRLFRQYTLKRILDE